MQLSERVLEKKGTTYKCKKKYKLRSLEDMKAIIQAYGKSTTTKKKSRAVYLQVQLNQLEKKVFSVSENSHVELDLFKKIQLQAHTNKNNENGAVNYLGDAFYTVTNGHISIQNIHKLSLIFCSRAFSIKISPNIRVVPGNQNGRCVNLRCPLGLRGCSGEL